MNAINRIRERRAERLQYNQFFESDLKDAFADMSRAHKDLLRRDVDAVLTASDRLAEAADALLDARPAHISKYNRPRKAREKTTRYLQHVLYLKSLKELLNDLKNPEEAPS